MAYRRRTTIRPGRQKTATKLICLENTKNIKRKTERETKIKSLRVSILLRAAGVKKDKFGKRPSSSAASNKKKERCEYEGNNS
jgi:hypothetical protein